MIGSLLSIWLVGKRPFLQALIFWFIYLFVMFIISFLLTTSGTILGMFSLLISIGIFVALAHYWYKFPWLISLKLWVIAFAIDLLISFIIIVLILSFVSIPFVDNLFPFQLIGGL